LDNVGLFKYPNVEPGPYYDVEYFHGHAQFSNTLYADIQKGCTEAELRGTSKLGRLCGLLIEEMAAEVGQFFPYNLYNACPTGQMAADKHGMNQALRTRRMSAGAARKALGMNSGVSSPCLGHAMADWFKLNETLAAIGAPPDTAFINLDNGHGFDYTSNQEFVGPIYSRALKMGLQVLVYEGDVDACGLQTSNVEDIFVPLFNSQVEMTRRWRPWTTDGLNSMAGYVIEWENRTAQFVSIRGSGHLVPLNRPYVSEIMMNAFTRGLALPNLAQSIAQRKKNDL